MFRKTFSSPTRYALIFAIFFLPGAAFPDDRIVRGDINADGQTDIGDAIALVEYQYLGAECSRCARVGDVNDDRRSPREGAERK